LNLYITLLTITHVTSEFIGQSNARVDSGITINCYT